MIINLKQVEQKSNNMKEIFSEELKTLQKEILVDVHKFCQRNGIRYSLALGTLLGAVRHGGFIPWDDDIDILMPREDYERFIASYNHSIYQVADVSTNNDYYLPFAKVSDSRTHLIEEGNLTPCFGVNVDVFPIDNVPDGDKAYNKFYKHKTFWNHLHWMKILKINKDRSFSKNAFLFFMQLLLLPVSERVILKKIQRIATKYRYTKTNRMGLVAPDDNKFKWIMDKKVFEEYSDIKFEDLLVRSVKDYDTYLKAMYGDYMKLPPVEQRVTHHGFKVYWKD